MVSLNGIKKKWEHTKLNITNRAQNDQSKHGF